MRDWLILVHRIPPRPLYLRAKIRQRLENAGAIAVKNSVYVLPYAPEPLEDLQWIAQEIVAGGGDAHLLRGSFVDETAGEAVVEQFRHSRDVEYAALVAEAHAALKGTRSAAGVERLAAAQTRLERRMEEIRRLDYLESPGRVAAEKALREIDQRLKRRAKEARMLKANRELIGRTWVTRPGVKVDRMATAWFIRRFIDARARFRFADENARPKKGELRFDMVGGDFTHDGDRCTLETLIRRVGLPDKGVSAIAQIVHDLDLKDAKFNRPETSGVRLLLDGLIARCPTDEERLERSLDLFDDLHESLISGTRRSRK